MSGIIGWKPHKDAQLIFTGKEDDLLTLCHGVQSHFFFLTHTLQVRKLTGLLSSTRITQPLPTIQQRAPA